MPHAPSSSSSSSSSHTSGRKRARDDNDNDKDHNIGSYSSLPLPDDMFREIFDWLGPKQFRFIAGTSRQFAKGVYPNIANNNNNNNNNYR
jgi:hypothetical protein